MNSPRINFVGLILLGLLLLIGTRASAEPSQAEQQYLRRLFRIQFDHHLASDPPYRYDPTADLTVESCEAVLKELGPGSVTVFAVGHDGWAHIKGSPFPEFPLLSKDSLAIWREACDRTRTPMYVYVSSLINARLAREKPEYARWFSTRTPGPQRIDHNSKYVDTMLIPLLKLVMQRYHPDGFWFDGDFWAIFPSWNPDSTELYTQKTGRKPPTGFGDSDFASFWDFTSQSHRDYMQRVAEVIHSQDPKCSFIVNAAFTLRQPEPVPEYLGRINIDPPLYFGLETACLESKFQTGRSKVPFDIVLGSYAEPEGAPFGYPKSNDQLMQELATVLSNGGHVAMYSKLQDTGGFDLAEVRKTRKVLADFCLPRQSVFVDAASVADIAVLHSRPQFAATHRLDEVRGAALAALRSQRHLDILDDATFASRHNEFRVLIVPEQQQIPDASVQAIVDFARNGGGVVLSLPSAVMEAPAATGGRMKLHNLLAEALGVQIEQVPANASMQTPDGPVGIAAPCYRVTGYAPGAQADLPISAAGQSFPGRIVIHVGKGKFVLLTAAVFDGYNQAADPRLRKLLDESIDLAASRPNRLSVNGSRSVEVVWRTDAANDYIHLVNHSRGEEFRPRAAAVPEIPSVGPLSIKFKLDAPPASVKISPAQQAFTSNYADGTLTVELASLHLHAAIIVTRGKQP